MSIKLKDFEFDVKDVEELECKEGLFLSYMRIRFKTKRSDKK